ncbi:MAG TPA: hypothetical protein VFF27_00080 [Bacteroidia bacterium]|jgi:hypothetical protein|nr:hypothetical protein [Bacteroidia bacterium]
MKLTTQELGMFIGCQCVWHENENIVGGILQGQWIDNYDPEYITVKPVLRYLSDMTDEEIIELTKSIPMLSMDDIPMIQDAIYNSLHPDNRLSFDANVRVIKYLIEKHFDVFGWIEKGLAIDKTKV